MRILITGVTGQVGAALLVRLPSLGTIIPADRTTLDLAKLDPFIHFSTDYVYDGHGERAWREDDQACPLSNYGNSKLVGENAIRASGGAFLIVRTSWVASLPIR
jgi:dTDP-4-dehydrorhamnose reductase